MLFRLLILAKFAEVEKKILDHNHDKYITTQELIS